MRPGTTESYRERILRVLVHIQNHLDDPLPLDDLASVACFSAYHFHRIFRGMIGESVMEHVRRLRLERAAQRLKYVDRPVTDIAFDAGYESHEAFTRAFRAMFGEAPSAFRNGHRVVQYRASPSGVHYHTVNQYRPPDAGAPPDVQVKTIDPMRVAFVRHVGPYDGVGAAWGKLMMWAGRRGLLGPSMKALGIAHDDPEITPPEKLRCDAALVVDEKVQPEGEVGIQEAGGGEYAVAMHKGPYDHLYETYAKVCGV